MNALTRKVFRDITRRKLRTALTILGIAVGIIGLSAISVASNQFKSSFAYSTDRTAQPDIQFFTAPTSAELATTLAQQSNVKAVQPINFVSTRWAVPSGHIPVTLIGIVDFNALQINRFQVVEGTLPGPGQILLESSDRALHPERVGDQIQVQINGNYHTLTISGFALTRGLPSASIEQNAQGYMGAADLQSLYHVSGVNSFEIRLTDYANLNETATQLTRVLNQNHVLIFASHVGRNEDVPTIADGLFATMDILSVIAILLSVSLLLGTIMALVTEQVQYIGTMKAIGGTRGKIIRHYLALVLVYGLIGTCIGLAVGIPSGYALAQLLGGLVNLDIGPVQITPSLIVEGFLVGLGTPLIAGAFPTYFGTRITVKQALSGYGIDTGAAKSGRGWAAFSRAAFALFQQTTQFGIRGLFRKRTRTVLTLMILTIAGAAFLAVQTASYSFNSLLTHVYSTYNFDAMAATPNALPFNDFQRALQGVSGVGRIEELSQDTVPTHWGNAQLTGIQLDSQLYQKKLVAGRWFTSGDTDAVIISQDAAQKSGLHVGDMLAITTSYNSVHWRIIGIADDYSGLGPGDLGVLLTPIAQAISFRHLPADYVDLVMVQSTSHAPGAVDALATRIDNALSAAGYMPNVLTNAQKVQQNQSKYQIIYILLDLVAIIIAFVGAIGLSNTLAMSILERRREIGILRSMGATGWKVMQVFWAEGTSLGILSWVLAVLLGVPAAYGFMQLQGKLLAPIPFAFNPLNVLWLLCFMLVVVVISGAGPVLGAGRVKIAQTLRYE